MAHLGKRFLTLCPRTTSFFQNFNSLIPFEPMSLQTSRETLVLLTNPRPLKRDLGFKNGNLLFGRVQTQQLRNLIIVSNDDSVEEESDEEEEKKKKAAKPKPNAQNTKPFYDPFNKKPAIEEPEDPTDLQDVFHKMREDGLVQAAAKMCDGLSQDGLTHEAMQLFAHMKDKGNMPDVVAHTAVVEAYSKAGKPKEALKVFLRMLASGVKPNSYSYSVLIQGLCRGGMLQEAAKYTLEMLDNKMKPNAGIYVTLVYSYLRAGKEAEIRELLGKMRGKGFVADDKAARQYMQKIKRFNRPVMDVLFGQFK